MHANNMHYKCANLMLCHKVVKVFTTPHYDVFYSFKYVK